MYFVLNFKWLCCHLKIVVVNKLGFLPKYGIPASMGMHNLYPDVKLHFFSLAKFYFQGFLKLTALLFPVFMILACRGLFKH